MPANDQPIEPFDPLALENVGVTLALELLEQALHAVPPERFPGAGVYVLYYEGELDAYAPLRELNRAAGDDWQIPVYVGRALRSNARQGFVARPTVERELYDRIRDHARSIRSTNNLKVEDFKCRYLVLNDAYIPLTESVLITTFRPLWNGMGLGSNGTGAPRLEGLASLWDSLHPGRKGRPVGTPEREREAIVRVAEAIRSLAEPHPDEPTQQMIEKIRRRAGYSDL